METTNCTNSLHTTNNTDLSFLSSSDEDEELGNSQPDIGNTSNGPLKCRECQLSFDLYQTLQLHILNVHRIEHGAAFNSSDDDVPEPDEHTQDDTDEPVNVIGSDPDEVPDPKPFKCTRCKKGFMVSKHLDMHMQVHELKQKTEAAFRGAAAVRGGGVYECRFCQAPQRSTSGLRAHERRHLRATKSTEKVKIPPKKRLGRSRHVTTTKSLDICADDDDDNEDMESKESDEWSNED